MKRSGALKVKAALKRGTRLRTISKKEVKAKDLDRLCREVVFARDGHRCVKTGRTTNLQWSHVYSRRYKSLRWHPDNSLTLNAGAHLEWHHKPLESSRWFEQTYPERATRLRALAGVMCKVDMQLTKLHLEQELRRLSQ